MNALPKRLPIVRAIALAGALAFGSVGALAQAEKPQPGGTLNVGLVYYTLSPLSWDPADWAWKFGQDTGLMYEQLFVGDLSKAKSHGGKLEFTADSWLPTDAIRGELAESWTFTGYGSQPAGYSGRARRPDLVCRRGQLRQARQGMPGR